MTRRPSDLDDALPLAALTAILGEHQSVLVDTRHNWGPAKPAQALAEHAVAALATQHALAERALATRWVNVVDALTYGANLDKVAAAMGLAPDEVTVGLRSWTDGQQQLGYMTEAEADEVLALIGRQ